MRHAIYPNLSNVFEIEEYDYNRVILKVKAETPLKVAQYPFLSGDWSYITVTRGCSHILTVVKTDGTTFSFKWGSGGHTIVADSLELLKANVVAFIQDENAILLDYTGETPKDISIYYNSNFNAWQLSINNVNFWNKDAKSVDEMIKYCEKFVKADWEKSVAQTGIDIWRAKSPVTSLK